MKNFKLTLASLLTASFASFQANALEARGPYIGVGYENSTADYQHEASEGIYGDDFNNLNIFGGYYFNDYLGVELSYTKSDESDDSIKVGSDTVIGEVEYSKLDLNAMYNHNLVDGDFGVDLVALAGGSYLRSDTATTIRSGGAVASYTSGSSDQFGVNAGLGLELPITREFSVRALAKYTHFFDNDELFDKMVSYNVGVKYSF